MLVYLFGLTTNYSSKLLEILVIYETAKEKKLFRNTVLLFQEHS